MKKSYGSVEIGEIEESSGGIQNKNYNNCTALEAASNQIAVVTGAGMLSLPYAASAMGWSVLVLLFILTLCFCYSYLLLVYSIDRVLLRNQGTGLTVDYAFLAREAFGAGGDRWVLVILISELFLALVSFLINIGLNVHIILPFVDVATAILCATAIATALSFADLKILSRVTAFGNVMTTLTVVAVALSGMYLPETGDLNSSSTPEWKTFDAKGIAVSLGVMAYCFGGHGAL
jgi:solute carrier family 32 (vesicular inhibitory amino acid transporter)